jgi:hypothetical protein
MTGYDNEVLEWTPSALKVVPSMTQRPFDFGEVTVRQRAAEQ